MNIYKTIDDVPIVTYAVVAHNHPDIDLILKAYKIKGHGIGVDYQMDFYKAT